jgi:hypothetical protein
MAAASRQGLERAGRRPTTAWDRAAAEAADAFKSRQPQRPPFASEGDQKAGARRRRRAEKAHWCRRCRGAERTHTKGGRPGLVTEPPRRERTSTWVGVSLTWLSEAKFVAIPARERADVAAGEPSTGALRIGARGSSTCVAGTTGGKSIVRTSAAPRGTAWRIDAPMPGTRPATRDVSITAIVSATTDAGDASA